MVRNPLHIKDNIPKLPMFTGPPYGITDNYGTSGTYEIRQYD